MKLASQSLTQNRPDSPRKYVRTERILSPELVRWQNVTAQKEDGPDGQRRFSDWRANLVIVSKNVEWIFQSSATPPHPPLLFIRRERDVCFLCLSQYNVGSLQTKCLLCASPASSLVSRIPSACQIWFSRATPPFWGLFNNGFL